MTERTVLANEEQYLWETDPADADRPAPPPLVPCYHQQQIMAS